MISNESDLNVDNKSKEITNEISNKKEDSLNIIKENRNDKEKQSNKKTNLILSRNVRWFIFVILILISIMVNMDHGTIPAATTEIKKSLNKGDDILGLFGSLVFFGNIIGIYN